MIASVHWIIVHSHEDGLFILLQDVMEANLKMLLNF
jgi:hypothetical protein